MMTDRVGLTYQEMKDLKQGERVKVYWADSWHVGTFQWHESTGVSYVKFDRRITKKTQKRTFVPNGLEFDEETFNRIRAGSHFMKIR